MKRGGKQKGAGRPKAEPKKQVTIRMTIPNHVYFKSIGGQKWFTRMLEESKENKT